MNAVNKILKVDKSTKDHSLGSINRNLLEANRKIKELDHQLTN